MIGSDFKFFFNSFKRRPIFSAFYISKKQVLINFFSGVLMLANKAIHMSSSLTGMQCISKLLISDGTHVGGQGA
jgi:hypothetical protein